MMPRHSSFRHSEAEQRLIYDGFEAKKQPVVKPEIAGGEAGSELIGKKVPDLGQREGLEQRTNPKLQQLDEKLQSIGGTRMGKQLQDLVDKNLDLMNRQVDFLIKKNRIPTKPQDAARQKRESQEVSGVSANAAATKIENTVGFSVNAGAEIKAAAATAPTNVEQQPATPAKGVEQQKKTPTNKGEQIQQRIDKASAIIMSKDEKVTWGQKLAALTEFFASIGQLWKSTLDGSLDQSIAAGKTGEKASEKKKEGSEQKTGTETQETRRNRLRNELKKEGGVSKLKDIKKKQAESTPDTNAVQFIQAKNNLESDNLSLTQKKDAIKTSATSEKLSPEQEQAIKRLTDRIELNKARITVLQTQQEKIVTENRRTAEQAKNDLQELEDMSNKLHKTLDITNITLAGFREMTNAPESVKNVIAKIEVWANWDELMLRVKVKAPQPHSPGTIGAEFTKMATDAGITKLPDGWDREEGLVGDQAVAFAETLVQIFKKQEETQKKV